MFTAPCICKIIMIMKAKKMYSAPKMERVKVELEAPIAYSPGGGGGGGYIDPIGGGGNPGSWN